MRAETKGWLGWAFRVLLTMVGGVFLATKLNWSEFRQIIGGTDFKWIFLAVTAYHRLPIERKAEA